MAFLEVKELSKHFGGLKAVNKVSMSVKENEILGLIGPNGAGKTTFFNLLTGYYLPTNGTILFEDHDVTNIAPPHRRSRLGLVRTFQVVKPFTNLTVLENVMVGGFSKTNSTADCHDKALQVLELVGMSRRKDTIASSLTPAERRRMEVARALAAEPKLLLLDEVMAGLTPTEISEFIAIMRHLKEEMGFTLLMIEHVMAVIMTIAERILVLHHGELICEGTPDSVCCNQQVIDAYLGEEFQIADIK
jgi:branched-chain amino acid transport system ATP-binding protein